MAAGMIERMIERLLAILFALIERIRPHTVDLGDDMDSLPYIPDSPEYVLTEAPTEDDHDARDPKRSGARTLDRFAHDEIEAGGVIG
jgi:hypothetical protein